MTRDQAIELVQEMRARWPHSEIPDAALAVLFHDLRHVDAGQARVAMLALYREGREFAPNGAQILAKLSELDRDDPDHGEAWGLVHQANLKWGLHREHGQDRALAWLEQRSPAVAEAVRRFGPDALATYNTADEGTVRAQFRDIYKAVVRERAHDAAYQGLPDVPLRRLQRLPRPLGEVVKEIGAGSPATSKEGR